MPLLSDVGAAVARCRGRCCPVSVPLLLSLVPGRVYPPFHLIVLFLGTLVSVLANVLTIVLTIAYWRVC